MLTLFPPPQLLHVADENRTQARQLQQEQHKNRLLEDKVTALREQLQVHQVSARAGRNAGNGFVALHPTHPPHLVTDASMWRPDLLAAAGINPAELTVNARTIVQITVTEKLNHQRSQIEALQRQLADAEARHAKVLQQQQQQLQQHKLRQQQKQQQLGSPASPASDGGRGRRGRRGNRRRSPRRKASKARGLKGSSSKGGKAGGAKRGTNDEDDVTRSHLAAMLQHKQACPECGGALRCIGCGHTMAGAGVADSAPDQSTPPPPAAAVGDTAFRLERAMALAGVDSSNGLPASKEELEELIDTTVALETYAQQASGYHPELPAGVAEGVYRRTRLAAALRRHGHNSVAQLGARLVEVCHFIGDVLQAKLTADAVDDREKLVSGRWGVRCWVFYSHNYFVPMHSPVRSCASLCCGT